MAIALVFLACISADPARATVRYVPDGSPTVQAAIDASVTGDTVMLRPGVHSGPGNRDIELRGRDLVITSVAGAEATIIDCQGAGRGFFIHEGETRAARIERLTIRNGYACGWPGGTSGAGLLLELCSVTIADCRILDNWACSEGGGIHSLCARALIERCVISGNSADDRGGGIESECYPPTIRDCIITGNWALEGGGVIVMGGFGEYPEVTGCTIAGNFATHGGGFSAYGGERFERRPGDQPGSRRAAAGSAAGAQRIRMNRAAGAASFPSTRMK